MSRRVLIAALALSLFPACTARFKDTFRKLMSLLELRDQSSLVLVENTTTEEAPLCGPTNRIVIERQFPGGRVAYCRDLSRVSPELSTGPVCPGGVSVSPFDVPPGPVPCSEMTVCGRSPSSVRVIGLRSDGGTIDELVFNNLPWGCDAKVEYSFDVAFPEGATGSLAFHVQPSPCPWCERQYRATCLPCDDLGENEQIQSGQVILTNCGATCQPCEVLGRPDLPPVPHGQGRYYFDTLLAVCGPNCNDPEHALFRVCNNGRWEGNPSFGFAECFDGFCGCSLPNDTVAYSHGATKRIYRSSSPPCGVECNAESLLVECNDGNWETGSGANRRVVPPSELATYPARTCSKRVCHCERPGRATIAAGTTRKVYRKVLACTERCSDNEGTLYCRDGTLEPLPNNPANNAWLTYPLDECQQEDCGCRVEFPDGTFLLLNNGSKKKVYRYSQNTPEILDACDNSQYWVELTCNNRELVPPHNPTLYPFGSCTTRTFSCTFREGNGNQVTVNHNAQLTVSKTSTPACLEPCENLTIRCDNTRFKTLRNGSWHFLTPAELSYYQSATACTPKNCNCNVNGHIIPFTNPVTGFDMWKEKEITNCDLDGCNKVKSRITCEPFGNGSRPVSEKGDDPYLYFHRNCTVKMCGCQVPWGGSIEHGRTVRVHNLERETCQTEGACRQQGNLILLTCANGQLTPPYDPAQFPFPNCQPAVCQCTWDSIRVNFGQTIKVYKAPAPQPGELCIGISMPATCQEGGHWDGPSPVEYPYATCIDRPDDGIGGGTGGGTGNDEGPGAGIKRRVGLGDGGGSRGGPCLSFTNCRQVRVNTSVGAFEKQGCPLPWGGGEVEFYGTVSAFRRQCVVRPDRCSNHRITRTCHFNGAADGWTESDEYKYPSCEERTSCP